MSACLCEHVSACVCSALHCAAGASLSASLPAHHHNSGPTAVPHPLLQGQITIGEIAEQLQLPTALVNTAVSRRLGTIIHAELRGTTLYTSSFLRREAGRIRGAFSAVTRCVCVLLQPPR
jgi:hypothetical protein